MVRMKHEITEKNKTKKQKGCRKPHLGWEECVKSSERSKKSRGGRKVEKMSKTGGNGKNNKNDK